jgi:dTDP-glucose 4,6-dehydratase
MILFEMGYGKEMIQPVLDRPGHDRRYTIDFSKAERELDWYPETSFIDGIRKTIAWYVEHREWWQRIKSGTYREYYDSHYGPQGVAKPVESASFSPHLEDILRAQ